MSWEQAGVSWSEQEQAGRLERAGTELKASWSELKRAGRLERAWSKLEQGE